MIYTIPFEDIATGIVADTFKTIAALIIPDTTAGHRARLRKLVVGPSDDAPADLNVGLKIARIADVSAGTGGTPGSTIAAAAIPKLDPGQVDAFFSAAIGYSAEPTAYETHALWQGAMNAHGAVIDFFDLGLEIVVTKDMLLGLLACPRTTTAIRLSGHLVIEWY